MDEAVQALAQILSFRARPLRGALAPQAGPESPKHRPKTPKMASRRPKMPPRRSKRRLRDLPPGPQEAKIEMPKSLIS
eukprot:8509954-Pyramimonas_sp.AAC.1